MDDGDSRSIIGKEGKTMSRYVSIPVEINLSFLMMKQIDHSGMKIAVVDLVSGKLWHCLNFISVSFPFGYFSSQTQESFVAQDPGLELLSGPL